MRITHVDARICAYRVRISTNIIDRLRDVRHNAGLIGSHVSAAMNSYVGVTCLAQPAFPRSTHSQKSDLPLLNSPSFSHHRNLCESGLERARYPGFRTSILLFSENTVAHRTAVSKLKSVHLYRVSHFFLKTIMCSLYTN